MGTFGRNSLKEIFRYLDVSLIRFDYDANMERKHSSYSLYVLLPRRGKWEFSLWHSSLSVCEKKNIQVYLSEEEKKETTRYVIIPRLTKGRSKRRDS